MTAHTLASSWKRRLVRSAAVLSVAAMTSVVVAADWSQYRGPKADGRSDEAGVASGFAKAKIAWKIPVGEGFGTFAVAGDAAYLFQDRQSRETLVAYNAKTGKEVWARPVDQTITDRQGGSNPRSTPAIDGDNVYVLSVNLKLASFDAKTGKQNWVKDVKAEMGGQDLKWGSAASPVIDDNRIYVAGGGAGKSMAAFDKKTGDVLWAVGNEKITHASPVPATIHGVKQVIFFMQSGLVSLAADSGKELWKAQFPFKVSTAASPIVGTGEDADIVYCSAGYDVGTAAFKIGKSGEAFSAQQLYFLKQENKEGHNVHHWSTPVYHEGHIYGIFGFKDFAGGKGGGAPVGCLELKTGQIKWRQPGFGSGGGTIFVDGHILVQGDAGKLALVEATPAGFKQKASTQIPGEKFWCAAIVANGKIYTRSKTEAVCIELK
ncbi:PQQ-binding-like beta-propeller repeat protein [Humisphaera borealis]|uniref:PQQ-binding-like beta-propeller repeat protein n=1 Tax=Humisphaera borealis TaxID=2807512 RepID=A0A7M2WV46_9BACT|nr:PQQ-binding-like beta-propeller repeat protein [Humisphaera borealis]QOV89336.1 PQQ-binding-like beta-propeller repeat protein [Humisphaera borealis]